MCITHIICICMFFVGILDKREPVVVLGKKYKYLYEMCAFVPKCSCNIMQRARDILYRAVIFRRHQPRR